VLRHGVLPAASPGDGPAGGCLGAACRGRVRPGRM